MMYQYDYVCVHQLSYIKVLPGGMDSKNYKRKWSEHISNCFYNTVIA